MSIGNTLKSAVVAASVAASSVAAPVDPRGIMHDPAREYAEAMQIDAPVITLDRSQRAVFVDEARVVVVNFHRQKGKDFVAACKAIEHAMRTGQHWYIVSLTQRQADQTFGKCKLIAKGYEKLLKKKILAGVSEEELEQRDPQTGTWFKYHARTIHLPNGATITSLPGRDPDTCAGLTGNIILTEFGLFPKGGEDHWAVLFPITNRGGFKLIVISTPRAKTHKFHELCENRAGLYSVHTCDIYQSVYEEGYPLYDAQGARLVLETREQMDAGVELLKKLYGNPSKWPREYECKFTGDLEALVRYALLEAASTFHHGYGFKLMEITNDAGFDPSFWTGGIAAAGRMEFGWDVARTKDLSVLWGNLNTRNVLPFKPLTHLVIMRNCRFDLQRHVIRGGMNTSRANVGNGDSTGLGMDTNETLATEFKDRWDGVNFAGPRKRELASSLATAYSEGTQGLPSIEQYGFVHADIFAIQKDDSNGRFDLDETDNPLMPDSHCDIAWSNALARRAGAMPMLPAGRPPSDERPDYL